MISKMKPAKDGGSRLAIVFNGSPLFSGDAGSGESEIRRWIIENDWLEAIVALPDQLFYNTGISTYVWVVTNRKPKARRGKVQLINAVDLFQKMRKSLGNKRNELSQANIDEIVKLYGEFKESERSKIFDNDDFGYRRIVVERPLRLNFQASPERIARLKEETAFQNLARTKKKGKAGEQEVAEGRALQEKIMAALAGLGAERVWKSRGEFEEALDAALDPVGKVPAPVRKAVLAALGERDETAEVCRDANGNAGARRRAARQRERAAEGGHPGVLRARGEAARPRRLDGRDEDEGRVRDPVHPALLQVHAASATRGDRGRHPEAGGGDPGDAGRGAAVSATDAGLVGDVGGSRAHALLRAEPWQRMRLKHLLTMRSGSGTRRRTSRRTGEFPCTEGRRARVRPAVHARRDVRARGSSGCALREREARVRSLWASEHAVVCAVRSGHDARWIAYLLHSLT